MLQIRQATLPHAQPHGRRARAGPAQISRSPRSRQGRPCAAPLAGASSGHCAPQICDRRLCPQGHWPAPCFSGTDGRVPAVYPADTLNCFGVNTKPQHPDKARWICDGQWTPDFSRCDSVAVGTPPHQLAGSRTTSTKARPARRAGRARDCKPRPRNQGLWPPLGQTHCQRFWPAPTSVERTQRRVPSHAPHLQHFLSHVLESHRGDSVTLHNMLTTSADGRIGGHWRVEDMPSRPPYAPGVLGSEDSAWPSHGRASCAPLPPLRSAPPGCLQSIMRQDKVAAPRGLLLAAVCRKSQPQPQMTAADRCSPPP
jgi:hypothetical protein